MCDVRSSHDNKPTTPSILEVTSLNLEGKKRWGNAPRLLRISDLIFAFLPSEFCPVAFQLLKNWILTVKWLQFLNSYVA